MNEAVQAAFEFSGFKIPQFSFNHPTPDFTNIDVKFDPSGMYDENTGIFKLTLKFKAIGKDETREADIISTSLEADFKFSELPSFEELPEYFYSNGVAIIFPYLRSFISTLTLQANAKLLIMPLLNLTGLAQELRGNTKVIKKG